MSAELRAEAQRLAKLVYENDVGRLGILLNSQHFSVNHLLALLKQTDAHGNTPLHLAATLGHQQVFNLILPKIFNCEETPATESSPSPQSPSSQSLSASESSESSEDDASLKNYLHYLREAYTLMFIRRNRSQWTAYDEAVARGSRETIAYFLKLINIYQIIVSIQHSKSVKKATKEKLLQHDFRIQMKFDLNSWIPLLSRFLPQDNITLYHQKNNFRLDFHIVPGGGDTGAMLWAKGKYSIILNSAEKTALFLNHDKKEGQWIITPDAGRRGAATNTNNSSSNTNNSSFSSPEGSPLKRGTSDLTLREILNARTAINDWLCDGDEQREPPLALTMLLHIDKDEISKQLNLVMSKPVQRPGLSTHNTVFTASSKSFFGLVGSGKTSTFGNFKANNYEINGLELVVRSRNEHLSKEDKDRHEQMKTLTNNFKTGAGAGSKSGNTPALSGPGSDLFDSPSKELEVLATDDNLTEEQLKTQLHDLENIMNECTQQFHASIAPESGFTRPSYEDYLRLTAPIKTQLGHGRKISSKVKRHPVKGKISLSENFPIQKTSLLNVIAAAAPKFRHFERLKEFMEMKMPEGFPVHLDCPIMATVSGQLSLLDLKIFKDPGSSEIGSKLFVVPRSYVVKKESSV